MFNKLISETTDWGTRLYLHQGEAYHMKLLTLNKKSEKALSLNNSFERTLYSLSGRINVVIGFPEDRKTSTLLPGTAIHISAGVPYALEALEISRLIEVSAAISVSFTQSLAKSQEPKIIDPNSIPKSPPKKKKSKKSKN